MAYKDPKDPRNKESKRQWYLRNKEVHKADRIKRTLRNKKYYKEFKKNKPCLDCKIVYPTYVLDFDHRDGTKKRFNISLVSSHSIETLQKEIDKCDLVCANCHRIRTHKRRNRGSIE